MTNRFFPVTFFSELYREHSSTLLRVGIIAAVLVLSARLATNASERYLLLVVGAVAAVVLIRVPPLGLLALVVGALVVPLSLGTGTQTRVNVAVLMVPVLVALWLADMLRRRQFHFVPSRTTLPLLALVGAATISFLGGGLLWNAFARTAPLASQAGAWAVFAFSAGAFLLIGNQVTDVRWLERLTAVFLIVSGVYMVARAMQFPPLVTNVMAEVGASSMFWVWTVALAAGQLFFNRKLHRGVQAGLVLLLVLTLGVGWFQARAWTSGWLPPMLAVGTVLTLRSWRLGLLAAIAGAAFVFVLNPDLINRVLGTESYSLYTRDAARDVLLTQVFPLSPILGLGPANYYWYTPLYPILGWYVNFNSHNNYIDILMQTGVVGMICFLWFVFEVGRLGWRLRTRFSGDFAQGYVYGCLGGLAGTLAACYLADWLLPFVYNIGLSGFRASVLAWLFLGGLVCLENIARGARTAAG